MKTIWRMKSSVLFEGCIENVVEVSMVSIKDDNDFV
jgi:hypothetical protein